MKYLLTTIFISGLLALSCKDKSMSEVATQTAETAVKEVPRKMVAEQYSSPDNMTEKSEDTLAIIKPTEIPEVSNQSSITEVKKDEKPVARKPAIPAKKVPKRHAEIKFEEYVFDFGEIMQGDKVAHNFTFKNTGNAPLSVTKADATCGCATPSIPFMDIMPGEEGFIGVNYNSVGKEGEESPQITIFTNAKNTPNIVLKLNGIVKVPAEESTEKDSVNVTAQDSTKSNF